jgi:hypothetical protein
MTHLPQALAAECPVKVLDANFFKVHEVIIHKGLKHVFDGLNDCRESGREKVEHLIATSASPQIHTHQPPSFPPSSPIPSNQRGVVHHEEVPAWFGASPPMTCHAFA